MKYNNIGDHDDIVVCTWDDSGTPRPTDGVGYRLEWSLERADGSEVVGVRFNPENPPTQTTGPSAMAQLGIDAVATSTNRIIVSMFDANGYVVDTHFLDKYVCCQGDPRDVATFLTARGGRRSIHGVVKSEDECIVERSVTLFRRRKGPDESIGSRVSETDGSWRVKTGNRAGTYYARVVGKDATDDQTGGSIHCLPDESREVRRR